MGVIKAVLFDAVGTLIYPSPTVAAAYSAAAARQGLRITAAETSKRFLAAFAAEEALDRFQHGGRTGPQREQDRWRRIVAAVFPTAPAPEQLFADLWAHFAQPSHWALFDDVEPLLAHLQALPLDLGVASNFDERLRRICGETPPLAACQRLFISSELGWKKPSPEFFVAVEQMIGLQSDEIMLVGDDLENDYLAARKAGWQAVWLNRSALHSAAEEAVDPASRITSLADLTSRDDLAAKLGKR